MATAFTETFLINFLELKKIAKFAVLFQMERFNKDVFSTFLIPAGNMEEVHVCSYCRYLDYSS